MAVLADGNPFPEPAHESLWNRMPRLFPLLIALGFAMILGWWTHGLKTFTSYSATLVEAGPLPRPAPPLPFVDESGAKGDATQGGPPFRLVQFFYGSCPGACPLAMSRMPRIEAALGDLVPAQLQLLSLSFDHDSQEVVRSMWIAHGRPAGWTMGTLTDPHADDALRRLGVLVIRRDDGLINHSVDLFLLDSQGQVRAVFSPDDPPEEIASAIAHLL